VWLVESFPQENRKGACMTTPLDQMGLPVAVIGGGPVGLAAAAHLVTRGIPVKLYEAGDTAAAHVRSWSHVRLFSPWRFNTDTAARAILSHHGWQEPPGDALPTGGDLYVVYLQPLAQTPELASVIETGVRIRSVSRRGIDKLVSRGRSDHPFLLALEQADGSSRIDLARAVIDASGTWATPNPLGAAGIPALGEARYSDRIAYGIPNVLGTERADYAGRRVLVIGGGHSAANALLDLARLAESDRWTRLTWAVRGDSLARIFGGRAADKLPARGKLGEDLKRLVESGRLHLVMGFRAEHVEDDEGALIVSGIGPAGPVALAPADRIVVATGQRPDLALTRELRLEFDPWLECPRALGPMIDPNLHSCGTVPPHGYRQLAHPEPGYFAVGIKSYGRAPTFLMATGYEQVRSVAAHLAGDEAAAADIQLVLPETGVCSTNLSDVGNAKVACCGGPAPVEADACCADDTTAKANGEDGCGSPRNAYQGAVDAAACCSGELRP
jgi:thioredoxin reductase